MVIIAPLTPPTDGVLFTSDKVRLKIADVVVGNGHIWMTQDALIWQPDNLAEGLWIPWRQISMHGIMRQPDACIFLLLDHLLCWRNVYEGNGRPNVANANGVNGLEAEEAVDDGFNEPMEQQSAGESDDEGNASSEDGISSDQPPATECFLIAEDTNSLQAMFEAMRDCQALHPDTDDSISSESDFMEDADDDFDDGYGPGAGGGGSIDDAADGMQNLKHLNLDDDDDDDDRFADAEE